LATPTRLSPDPSPAQTLVAAAASAVRRKILDGTLAIGERVPPERALMVELGVSRTVLREALASLDALGLIETRGTRGRFVAAAGASERSDKLVSAWLFHNGSRIDDFDDVRSLLEAQAVIRTPAEALPAIGARVHELVEEQRSATRRGDVLTAADLDSELHRAIVSGCPNPVLRSLVNVLIEHMQRATIAVYAFPGAAEKSLAEHVELAGALTRGDPEGAAVLVSAHHAGAARVVQDAVATARGGANPELRSGGLELTRPAADLVQRG
jgi:DNA-binding FadR family transcriptional regulator